MESYDWISEKPQAATLLAHFWQQRSLLAEKELVTLEDQLPLEQGGRRGRANDDPPTMDTPLDVMGRSASLQFELAAKEKEIQTLIEDVQRLQSTIAQLRESSARQLAHLEEELELRSRHIQRLEAQLEAQKDYQDIRRELSLLKSVETVAKSSSPVSRENTHENSEQNVKENLHSDYNPALKTSNEDFTEEAQTGGQSEEASAPSATSSRSASPVPAPLSSSHTRQGGASTMPSSTIPASVNLPTGVGPPPFAHFLPRHIPPVFHPALGLGSLGPFFNEDMLMQWRRSLEASIINQQQQQQQQEQSNRSSPVPPAGVHGAASPSPANEVPTETSEGVHSTTRDLLMNHANPALSAWPSWEDSHLARLQQEFMARGGIYPGYMGSTPEDGLGPLVSLPEGLTSLLAKSNPLEARLQEMLRATMERYASQALDTLAISRGVRELLSVHNIGQRLFAKFVLGLSQGTVSELLSKPKPWDKLTEKGRDSYRKMHAWACDEAAILLLKSLIPRKGKECSTSSMVTKAEENNVAEERIAHILSEASAALRAQQVEESASDDSKPPSQAQTPSPGPKHDASSTITSSAKRGRKPEHDDISQEQVLRIYQEELSKMMSGNGQPFSAPFPFNPALRSSIRDYHRTPEEIRLALDVYQQELSRIMQHNPPGSLGNNHVTLATNGLPQDLSLPKLATQRLEDDLSDKFKSGADVPTPENGDAKQIDAGSAKVKNELSINFMPHSLHNILRPSSNPSPEDGAGSGGGVASPLQRIASITNSLISQPSNQALPQVTQRPMKAILPPITQQQFDAYQNLNTEDIVKKVKEQLSQYSISQRLFGESVLGLSQGSVSDLLARPKPWHMLTQKGREPFIRMKMFLEDENAVHKLVASQYKIAPEKLMRTGGYAVATQAAVLKNQSKLMTPPTSHSGVSTPQLPAQDLPHPGLFPGLHSGLRASSQGDISAGQMSPGLNFAANMAHLMSSVPGRFGQLHSSPVSRADPPTNPKAGSGPGPTQGLTINGTSLASPKEGGANNNNAPSQSHALASLATPHSMYSLPSQSVYELAALTQDLDTQSMTTKVKEVLLANNIGQKIFGEAVLGLSQGSVSELLSKPKPWHMLSIKGREPFIRMQLWLCDPRNIEQLQRLKNERREAGKRRRDTSVPSSEANPNSNTSSNANSSLNGGDNSSNEGSIPSPGDPSSFTGGGASVSSSSPSPAKKQRILFSDHQKAALKLAFSLDPYPSTSTIEFLAQELSLSPRTITNWFHNHRMRLKQQPSNPEAGKEGSETSPTPTGRESSSQFDPIRFRLLLHQKLLEMQSSGENSSLVNQVAGLAGIPSLAGNLNMMASLGLPYPFYATGMLSQFCLGLNNSSSELGSSNTGGLDLSLARTGQGGHESDGDMEGEVSDCESESSNRTADLDSDVQNKVLVCSPHSSALQGHENPVQGQARSSRRSRKPAAPQWVNPHWQRSPPADENDKPEEKDEADSKAREKDLLSMTDEDIKEEVKSEEDNDNC